ncbi:hypothetical protein AB0F53_34210, partial [Micromonospora aurantiaca]
MSILPGPQLHDRGAGAGARGAREGAPGGTSGSTCPGRSIMKLAAEMEIHIAVNFMIDGAEGGR